MFDLIRLFEKKEYVNDFLNGNLYMNSIGHFWAIGPAVQNDIMEGIGETLSPEKFELKYNSNFATAIGREHILFPFMNRLESMKYCHVCCLSLHEYDDNNQIVERFPDEMRKMGDYAVIVRNVQKFVDLIFKKLVKEKLYGLMGPVTYHSPFEENGYMDLFDKMNNHSFEHEWRFAFIPDYEHAKKLARENMYRVYDEHCYFSIGNIKDIAEEININTLFNDIGSLYAKYGKKYSEVKKMPIPWENRRKTVKKMIASGIPVPYDVYPNQYVGWGSREAFRNIVMGIDKGEFNPLFTIR